jgi:arachidonate 15-lipoxygenase
MKPLLPQYDENKLSRTRNIEDNQKVYKYKYDYAAINGVAMLEGIPKSEIPEWKWSAKAIYTLFKIAINLIPYGMGFGVKKIGEIVKAFFKFISILIRLFFTFIYLFFKIIFSKNKDEILKKFYLDFKHRRSNQIEINLKNYNNFFRFLKIPKVSKDFQEDRIFAQMRVAGMNPVVLKLYNNNNFSIIDNIFKKIKGLENDSFIESIKNNRVYITDYEALKEIKNNNFHSLQKYSYTPKALFVLPSSNKVEALIPIAIQCEENGIVFTPNDGYSWEMAKTIVQIADVTDHELRTHLAGTHLLMEPFMVSTHRQFYDKHPLKILLLPHFEGIAYINYQAQDKLINEGGIFSKIFAGTMESNVKVVAQKLMTSFNESMLPFDLEKRGMNNPKLLYPYREDGLKLWNATESWVLEYIDLYYKDDNDIINDKELQDWAKEIIEKGKIKGFGEENQIKTKKYLTDAITMIIFTSSTQHSAVNFTQQDYAGYSPNMPTAGYTEAPQDTNKTEEDWFKLIAPVTMSDDQTDLMFILSGVHYTTLGNYKWWHFKDKRISPLLIEFQNNLKTIEKEIKQRNEEDKENAYTYMLPSSIPQSINI